MLNYTSKITKTSLVEISAAEFLIVSQSDLATHCIDAFRAGDADAKKKLPAVCYMGRSRTGVRKAADMVPTGFVMLDVDHMEEDKVTLFRQHIDVKRVQSFDIYLIHITPSGKGIRIVAALPEHMRIGTREEIARNVVEYQSILAETLKLQQWGDVDECVKDLSRLSFVPKYEDIIYLNHALFDEDLTLNITDHDNQTDKETNAANNETSELDADDGIRAVAQCSESSGGSAGAQTEDGRAGGSNLRYGGVLVSDIAREYVKDFGEPEDGQRHAYYNRMVADFRNICNNDPEVLVDVLPLLGQTREHRLSQCKSICSRNSTKMLPKVFYAWLKEKGYFVDTRKSAEDIDDEDFNPYAEEEALLERMPALPPVFREIVGAAPKNYKIATLFALMPIVGTAATYLQSELYDGTIQTPSFYTIIHAPAGSGKSFVKRFLELSIDKSTESNLLHKIIERDFVSNARVNLWNLGQQKKGANDKSNARPKVSSRICETITSQADLLPVMKDNQGMHMFMFAAEIDTLMKGMKAGGGDKNDIFRIAWDNECYGQSYRSSISFRGKVPMYLNVLATGTENQMRSMFKNVENGLTSRCLFTDLGDQRFAKYQPWKKFSKRDLQVIDAWRARCDAETYKAALACQLDAIEDYETEEAFDENVPWEYEFKGRQTIDFSELNKKLLKWLEDERVKAEKNADYAHDAFRKRAAINGFRAAIAAYSCWKKVTKKEMQVITDFALFIADIALLKYLKTWGNDYNKLYAEEGENMSTQQYGNLFDSLPKVFGKGELKMQANRMALLTPLRKIVSKWKTANLIKKIGKNEWEKL